MDARANGRAGMTYIDCDVLAIIKRTLGLRDLDLDEIHWVSPASNDGRALTHS